MKGKSAECAILEFELQELREELRSYDQQLPCWSAEVAAAEAWAEQLEQETKEDRSHSEFAAASFGGISPASSEGERDYAEAQAHEVGFVTDSHPLHFAGHASHARHAALSAELTRRESSTRFLRQASARVASEAVGAARAEAAELRAALAEAEAEAAALTAQREAAQAQEAPLRQWVANVEAQVAEARRENARLAGALTNALAFQEASLAEEVGVGGVRSVDPVRQAQVRARKAKLREEIAAEERRRDQFLREAASASASVASPPRAQPKALSPSPTRVALLYSSPARSGSDAIESLEHSDDDPEYWSSGWESEKQS